MPSNVSVDLGVKMLKFLAFGMLSALSSTVSAQSPCAQFQGQTLSPLSFEEALSKLPDSAPKGEFETTAQYESRRTSPIGRPGLIVVQKSPEDRAEYIRYDADTQQLGVKTYAFDNTSFDAWSAFYSTPHAATLNASTLGNIDVVISQSEKLNGTYEGQNAYGAKWTVVRVNRNTQAIYDRATNSRESMLGGLFPAADKSPYMVGYLNMPSEAAQQLKPTLKLAFAISPKEPFVVRRTFAGRGKVTIQNPRDVTETATVLIADIQCGLVLDGANKVLGAYPTR